MASKSKRASLHEKQSFATHENPQLPPAFPSKTDFTDSARATEEGVLIFRP
jgi:hypothetical protein